MMSDRKRLRKAKKIHRAERNTKAAPPYLDHSDYRTLKVC